MHIPGPQRSGITPSVVQGTICGVGNQMRVGHMQSKCFNVWTISLVYKQMIWILVFIFSRNWNSIHRIYEHFFPFHFALLL